VAPLTTQLRPACAPQVSLIDGCGEVFGYLEQHLAAVTAKSVQTLVLRVCNALLRRVSKVRPRAGHCGVGPMLT
jgi:hypothetical protein